ncbi:MAG TPA: ABC transporter ATP-binding protein [Spirochaetia bacterium]|nr:ABC transporter ATP-binding protein [Spirochaetia bacterium]
MEREAVLDIRDLAIEYTIPRGTVHAVSSINLEVRAGEILGLAGESGCGKSTVAYSIMGLLRGTGRVSGGTIDFRGTQVVDLKGEQLRAFRWDRVSMVLQSAMNNLNPVITVREQLCDAMEAHSTISKKESLQRARELLRMVQIEEERLSAFPHQLSGGMRQRVVIAMALALRPDLVIMDEPTTGLDVVVQYAIMREIARLSRELGFAILIISHDLPLLLEICDRLAIMYAGKIVELGDSRTLLTHPAHPYTQGLLNAFPPLVGPPARLEGIPGTIPDLVEVAPGCLFRERCKSRMAVCDTRHPATTAVGANHTVACYLVESPANASTGGSHGR